MSPEVPVTAVEAVRARRRVWSRSLAVLLLALFLIGLLTTAFGLYAWWRFSGESTAYHPDIEEHFKYGSIGSEPESGLPYWIWRALPELFHSELGGQGYEAFGFLYEDDGGGPRDLPIGIARREVRGVELVWLNCAVCHSGTWRADADAPRQIVLGMPAQGFDLYGFIRFLFDAAVDERFGSDSLMDAMEGAGADFGWLEALFYRLLVIPTVREELLARRARLLPLLDEQPAWGPGRVDTFNPYKLLQFGMTLGDLSEAERIGPADLPSIWLQGPRGDQVMQLHWDGNNRSLRERNLSAAIGAGVTEETVDHQAIERVAAWLRDLPPPPSPLAEGLDPEQVAEGARLYARHCLRCHGRQGDKGYVFEGEDLGEVVLLAEIGTDPGRFESYTAEMAELQKGFFADDPDYRFRHFEKTEGYANHPLDGLWLRAPYLHNGAVPSLEALLAPPEARPRRFLRGLDVIDRAAGGFAAPDCPPGDGPGTASGGTGACFDTALPGNGNGGHLYGTDLAPAEKAALVAYLKTF